ncbi:Zinc uptake regulation protein [bioreactor metagenome]|uniref:Zinc uptake regulation protein n=1 Tax=bioreactor metagenome TaxID=1076179 RepID=A0A645G530_9ZZZZ
MNDIIIFLREKNCRVTTQRKAILNSLANCGQYFSAQEVFDDVKRAYPDVSFDTIYRNLNLFSMLGLLQQIHLPKGDGHVFEITEVPHPHLICFNCGKILCVDNTPVELNILNKVVGDEFTICRYSLEIYGYCSKCRATQQAANRSLELEEYS